MDAVQTAIKDKIIVVQGRQVILDSDVAALYGVETKRVNEAIKNNRLLRQFARRGKCIVMISHDLFIAPHYLDEALLMKEGAVFAGGLHGNTNSFGSLEIRSELPAGELSNIRRKQHQTHISRSCIP